jgi:hypothetical protein
MGSESELVRRALTYPYPAPPESFLLVGGETLPIDAVELDLAERVALLAYGSNAAPEVLRRKLDTGSEPLAAVRGSLGGFDVVYSAHVSAYGAVPATLWRSEGAELPVFVLFLTQAQAQAVAATEPNYELERLEGARCALGELSDPTGLSAYISRHGPLLRGGAPLAVAEIDTRGRTLPALGQRAAIEAVRRTVRPAWPLERFIVESASRPELPPRWTAALRSNGGEAAQAEPGEEAVDGGEDAEVEKRTADRGP